MSKPLVVFDKVQKHFGDFVAVKELDFEIREGELTVDTPQAGALDFDESAHTYDVREGTYLGDLLAVVRQYHPLARAHAAQELAESGLGLVGGVCRRHEGLQLRLV